MKITPKNHVKKFQEGGPIEDTSAQEQVPVQQEPQQQNPLEMVAQLAVQALQNQDCNAAMQVCQSFLEIIQQMQGEAPAEPQGEPVFRKGGILTRRIKK